MYMFARCTICVCLILGGLKLETGNAVAFLAFFKMLQFAEHIILTGHNH